MLIHSLDSARTDSPKFPVSKGNDPTLKNEGLYEPLLTAMGPVLPPLIFPDLWNFRTKHQKWPCSSAEKSQARRGLLSSCGGAPRCTASAKHRGGGGGTARWQSIFLQSNCCRGIELPAWDDNASIVIPEAVLRQAEAPIARRSELSTTNAQEPNASAACPHPQ